MIDFSTLQGLEIPEGVVTQIYDAARNVLWAVSGGKVILEVDKIASNTYAGETTYENEQFILLDIYPKTNGTVTVTYGGLTKTIIDTSGAAEPNAQQVYFGTFNGVTDEVETPASGTLTIEGDYAAFGIGAYDKTSKDLITPHCSCITEIIKWGDITYIPDYAFDDCTNITNGVIPNTITNIGFAAFRLCSLANIVIPDSVKSIGNEAFGDVSSATALSIGKNVTNIGSAAFYNDIGLTRITIYAKTPPTLPNGEVFHGVSCPFIVPVGCGEVYKTAEYWSTYADYIVEAS